MTHLNIEGCIPLHKFKGKDAFMVRSVDIAAEVFMAGLDGYCTTCVVSVFTIISPTNYEMYQAPPIPKNDWKGYYDPNRPA
jgi:hypothetical protein